MPEISVLMANYNKAEFISKSIQSVLNQSFKNWELIIIDDCSVDDSVAKIKNFLNDGRIRFLQNEKNLGFERTLIKLANEAHGEIIVLFDSDDVLKSNCLEELLQVYNCHPELGFVYSQCLYCNQKLIPEHVGYSAELKEGKTNLHISSVVAVKSFKKDLFIKAASYDIDIDRAVDLNFVLKIEEIAPIYFLNKILYLHRVLPTSMSHGFVSFLKHKSSSALVKYWAYKRRLNTDIPNLNKIEITEVLFWGIFSSLFCGNWKRFIFFIKKIFKINPFWFFSLSFYSLIFKKIKKIFNLKSKK